MHTYLHQHNILPMIHNYLSSLAHYDNDVWSKRKEPPNDWDKALPEWLQKRNENTLLDVKSRQAKGDKVELIGERYLCTIM